MIRMLQVLSNKTVVIDFAVDREGNGLIGIGEWLGSALCSGVSRSPQLD
jgi:hypothetical protein